MLLHFALVLHFAAIVITFCVSFTFCGDYYILRRNVNVLCYLKIPQFLGQFGRYCWFRSQNWFLVKRSNKKASTVLMDFTHNRRQKSLEHICNSTSYLCFTTEVWKSTARAILLETPICFPSHPVTMLNSVKIAGISFQFALFVEGRGYAGEVLFTGLCVRVRVCESAKSANWTFVDDCRCNMHGKALSLHFQII